MLKRQQIAFSVDVNSDKGKISKDIMQNQKKNINTVWWLFYRHWKNVALFIDVDPTNERRSGTQ